MAVTKFYGMRGATVAGDGTIVFAEGDGSLTRVPPGGTAATLLALDAERGERNFVGPVFLPGDRALVFSVASTDVERFDDGRVDVLDLRTNERRTLINGGMDARYSPSGHLVYAHRGSLHVVAFDLDNLQVTGWLFGGRRGCRHLAVEVEGASHDLYTYG